jgi:hypothetical protein
VNTGLSIPAARVVTGVQILSELRWLRSSQADEQHAGRDRALAWRYSQQLSNDRLGPLSDCCRATTRWRMVRSAEFGKDLNSTLSICSR